MTMSMWQDMVNLFYPQLCCGCDIPLMKGEQHLCLHCYSGLPYTGFETLRGNPMEHIFTGRTPLAWASALLYFSKDASVQSIVHQIKYKGNRELAHHMGRMMGRSIKGAGLEADLLIPVPLHPQKEWERGYNQSTLLAEGIATEMGTFPFTNILAREKVTATQTRKTRVERWENVGEAFTIKEPSLLSAKKVLLVDDVTTTGATLEACAIRLQEAGCASVAVSTLGFATHW